MALQIFTFFVPGRPQGKERARVSRWGAHYTPQRTKEYEEKIRERIKACGGFFKAGPNVSVRAVITAIYTPPKRFGKAMRAAMIGRDCNLRPDWDNIGKVITDALNGIAYDDDRQIADCRVVKRYGEEEGVTVELITEEILPPIKFNNYYAPKTKIPGTNLD